MRLIFSAKERGGCEAVLPVMKHFSKEGGDILCLMEGLAKDLVTDNNFPVIDASNFTDEQILEEFQKFHPDIVVTGTSLGRYIDKNILDAAKVQGVKSISLVDSWLNYWKRFKDEESGRISLPNFICVVDEMMKKEMIEEGFNGDIIKITGNPYFDEFTQGINSENVKKNQILFVSQPLLQIAKFGIEFEYDEMKVLQDLLDVIKRLNAGNNVSILLRLHPRDKSERFKRFLQEHQDIVRLDTNKNVKDSISESRVVIGFFSIVLFQAALGRKRVISYQPGINPSEDKSILNKMGIAKTAYTKEELANMLRKTLENDYSPEDEKLINKYIHNNSTLKVAEFIKQIVR